MLANHSRPTVVISSTILDLPDYREEVRDACERMGMFPLMMEHLPASEADAVGASLALVDKADIYVGVYAHRYGFVPPGYQTSITEMEYDRAVERRIPRLLFVMDAAHPVPSSLIDKGDQSLKLDAFKQRVANANIVVTFSSPADLRAHVIYGLLDHRPSHTGESQVTTAIPAPPDPYVAYPYLLLETRKLIGRRDELETLSDWVVNPESSARIMNVWAVAGEGKSALAWNWFNDLAPSKMTSLAGRIWWSFYETDARFDNFVIRALAYVTRRTEEETTGLSQHRREEQLLAALDREPFLIVLDGLERILLAFAHADTPSLTDDALDERTGNQLDAGQHRLRKAVDARVGSFLKRLVQVQHSRILITTQLYPADLQTVTGGPLPGSAVLPLQGLSDEDALQVWSEFRATGSRDELLRMFHQFNNHSLLIHALASEVARFRRAPGDFDRWRQANPGFNVFGLDRVQAKSHVLRFSLAGLNQRATLALQVLSAFRMPVGYQTIAALLVDEEALMRTEVDVDSALSELDDRGLVGWDRQANRYDIHPLIRGIVWSAMLPDEKRAMLERLERYLGPLSFVPAEQVKSLDDLTPAIELFHTLVGLGRFEDAIYVYRNRLDDPMHYRISASKERAEMLERLFPEGIDRLPHLGEARDQIRVLNSLAVAYALGGQPGRSIPLYERCLQIDPDCLSKKDIGLFSLPKQLRICGDLRRAEASARRCLLAARQPEHSALRECYALDWLGVTLAARGDHQLSAVALNRALRMSSSVHSYTACDSLATRSLWLGEYEVAKTWAVQAANYCEQNHLQRGLIRALGLQGLAAVSLGDMAAADRYLHDALAMARAGNEIGEELPVLLALAEMSRRSSRLSDSRDLLDQFWEPAQRGPYVLLEADGFNILAQIERDAGNYAAAKEAATDAYRKAWCQGPPFAYAYGLGAARQLLAELGAPAPTMLNDGGAELEVMPEVEIDPQIES